MELANWFNGSNAASSSLPYLSPGGDDVRNVYSWAGLLVGGLKLTETLQFQAGGGYRMDNAKNAPGPPRRMVSGSAYAQAVITLAPGVYMVPEVGYHDFMDDVAGNDEGYRVVRRRQVADRFLIQIRYEKRPAAVLRVFFLSHPHSAADMAAAGALQNTTINIQI